MTSINYQYNIISSNCIGGWYYRLKGLPFQNPFIWDTMKISDFIILIKKGKYTIASAFLFYIY